MIWVIVYGGLAVATLVLLALPTVRVVQEVRVLNRVVAVSGRRIEMAVAELNQARSRPPVALPGDPVHRKVLG